MIDKLKILLLFVSMAFVCIWLLVSVAPHKIIVVLGIGLATFIAFYLLYRNNKTVGQQAERKETLILIVMASLAAFGMTYSLPPFELLSATMAATALFLLLFFMFVPKKSK